MNIDFDVTQYLYYLDYYIQNKIQYVSSFFDKDVIFHCVITFLICSNVIILYKQRPLTNYIENIDKEIQKLQDITQDINKRLYRIENKL